MEYELKDNGYEIPEEWKKTIEKFNSKIKELFQNELIKISHFNYANCTIMTTVVINGINGTEYCGYRLGKKISCTDTYTCSHDNMKKFESVLEK